MNQQLANQLKEANPWWESPTAIKRDPHIRRSDADPVQWDPPVMEAMPLHFEDTHTLRGPRQVGKTTTIKRLIERLVGAGERRVLYFSFDTGRRAGNITETIQTARQIHPEPDGSLVHLPR